MPMFSANICVEQRSSLPYMDKRLNGLNNAEPVNNDSFERLKNKNRRKKITRKIFYFVFSIALVLIISILCAALFFDLKKTEIRGNEKYSADEILSACDFGENPNLILLNTKNTEKEILNRFPYISQVDFKKVLPSTLIITITEDLPIWCTEISNDWFVLSSDLRIISRHSSKEDVDLLGLSLRYISLPEISSAVTGEKVSFVKENNYDYMTSFISELMTYDYFSSVNAIDAEDRYHMALYSENGRYKILIGSSENLDSKLKFVLKLMKEEFGENYVASVNVEYLTSVIVLKQDELFSFP